MTCPHGRRPANAPRCPLARAWSMVLAFGLSIQAALPLLHLVIGHPSATGHADRLAFATPLSTAHQGAVRTSSGDDNDGPGRRPCPTCDELLLIKLAIPWHAPEIIALPGRLGLVETHRPQSRAVPVTLSIAPPRGPPPLV